MGPDGCSRQLFGNDTMREFIVKAVSVCGWGGDGAAHVILAMCMARCAGVNHAKSQSDTPLSQLSITIFCPMISDSTKKCFLFVPLCYCSFGVHMRVSDEIRTGEQISWKQILRVTVQITRTQQKKMTQRYSCS